MKGARKPRHRSPYPYLMTGFLSLLAMTFMFPLCFAASQSTVIKGGPSVAGIPQGWIVEGEPAHYNPENLYTYINGEAELYIPFGFSALESIRYVNNAGSRISLVADIFRMGSVIDAFGIYSYYRNPAAEAVDIGTAGYIDESELMFYKDHYFVRLSTSGDSPPQEVFKGLARTIANSLPGSPGPPQELALLSLPGVVPRTEKYTAQSVLGYAFFKRGLTADANLSGKRVRVFVILDESTAKARNTFDAYLGYLEDKGGKPRLEKTGESVTLTGQDPLYKGVLVRQSGSYVFGITNLDTPPQ